MSRPDGPVEPDASPLLSPRRVRWLVTALVGWSFLLRLAFAGYGLHPGRFYDERYSLENLRAVLAPAPTVSGLDRLRPVNGWYPSLSHLPQVPVLAASRWLHRLTGDPRFAIFPEDDPQRGFTPTARFLCRATVSMFGALTLVLTFLVGRRLFGVGAGLLGALILAASPAHLRHSAMFKPDMLLTLLTLTVFVLTLRQLEPSDSPHRGGIRRRRGRIWAASGAAVGLAAASKLNGLLTALIPTAVATGRAIQERAWRPLVGLAVSGATAVAVFLLLNPFLGLYSEYLERNLRIYSERAALAGLDRPAAFRALVEHLLSPGFHGPWLGAVALAACVALAAMAVFSLCGKRWSTGPWRLRGLLPLWVIGYGVAYAATAAYPKANNLLPLLPFTSLAAAWGIVGAVRFCGEALHRLLARRRPGMDASRALSRGLRRLGVALAVVATVLLLAPLHVHAYRTAVPTTGELLERALRHRLQPFAGRTVIYRGPGGEGSAAPLLLTRREAVAVIRVPDPESSKASPSAEQRRWADAEVWVGRDLIRERPVPQDDVPVLRFEPSPGRAWGPPVVAWIHPWELVGSSRHWADEDTRRWSLPLDSVRSDEAPAAEPVLSVQVLVRKPEPPLSPPRLEVAGRSVPLYATRVETGGYVYGTAYTSRRFRWHEGDDVVVVLAAPASSPRPPVADVLVWKPSAS